MSEAVNPSTGPVTRVFSAQVEGRPVIYGVQGQTAQPLLTLDPADFGLADQSADLGAFLSPDGSRVAYVVTDSSQQNPAVQIYNLGDRQTTELIRYNGSDRLSCFIWKPDGSALGFMRTTPSQDETQPYICQIWTVPAGGGDATKIYGDNLLQFLGWSADGQHIHLTRRLKGLFAYSIFDLGNGQFQDVLLPSDYEQNHGLDIIGLTYGLTSEQTRLAYVLNASPYLQNCDSTPLLVVEAQTGQPTSQIRTDGAAISLTFAPDLTMLAFATYKFPDGTGTTVKPASDPAEALSGVSVLNLADNSLRSLLTPQAGVGQYRLLAWAGDNSGLFVGGADGSVQFVDFQGNASQIVAPSAETTGLSVGGSAGVQALGVSNAVVNLDVPYIHQIKMTPDSFDGNWACGPTSATMVAAYYGKLTPRHDVFMGNPTQYGWYVANSFKSNATGVSFDRAEKDASGHPAAGAYGQAVENGEGYAWRMTDYLTKLGLSAKFRPNVALNVIKDYLNDGKPIVLSTNLHGFGHLVCLKGYTSDGRWIVNDPYWGKPGAGQVVYSWGDFQGPPWMITVDTPPPSTNQPPTQPVVAAVAAAKPAPAPSPAAAAIGPGSGNDGLAARFQAAFDRLGGVAACGQASDKTFVYNGRTLQDFKGGTRGEGVLVADSRADRPGDQPVATVQPVFGVFGAFLKAWRDSYGGSAGSLGSPVSDQFVNAQGDRQQNFEGGYITLQGSTDSLKSAFPWPTAFNGWRAEYYNNTGLAGKPAFLRDEPPASNGGFHFDWGAGAPDDGQTGILNDNFSARWSRSLDFGPGGTYDFVVTVDDGFRLLIDGQNLAGPNGDQFWQVSGPVPHTFRVAVGGGIHHIALEYFEAGGNALVGLDITKE